MGTLILLVLLVFIMAFRMCYQSNSKRKALHWLDVSEHKWEYPCFSLKTLYTLHTSNRRWAGSSGSGESLRIPQSPHVAIETLIVVVSTAFGGGLPGASHAHFTQIPLGARKTAFPKHLVVHWGKDTQVMIYWLQEGCQCEFEVDK